ncbi:hypothetical protein G5I_09967 [Acromyrmex echinatior]|uniref:Double jelly roll-like domain-containing protein n=1 Tax=Acromyrmex echinatior TaxID=103372 RepID=F4WVM1_ACREC|nr:hypothetical protein G5I_09967 [Acromyrmex echinatior]
MSLMLTLTGKSSVLAMSYFLAVDLGDGDYKLSLTDFEMYYTLANYDNFFYIEGRLMVKKKNQMSTTLGNNCVAFMFDEIRYELNGVEVDRNKNIGITRNIKNYVSMTYEALITLNAEWNSRSDRGRILYFLRASQHAVGLL